ncbi:hypothetical protein [Acrocarpospora sp. B8E8]|uniref:hypothetical protein n=1 Tax=Acrocarpospora sp. B8E8 TaxID=3153572 RepID=UPI00325C4D2A
MADKLARRAYELEVERVKANLVRELVEVRRALDAIESRLADVPASQNFASDARRLAVAADDVASYSGALDMANRLVFLLDDEEG